MNNYILPARCPKCGTGNPTDLTICRGCGKKIKVKLPGPKNITDTGKFGL